MKTAEELEAEAKQLSVEIKELIEQLRMSMDEKISRGDTESAALLAEEMAKAFDSDEAAHQERINDINENNKR